MQLILLTYITFLTLLSVSYPNLLTHIYHHLIAIYSRVLDLRVHNHVNVNNTIQ